MNKFVWLIPSFTRSLLQSSMKMQSTIALSLAISAITSARPGQGQPNWRSWPPQPLEPEHRWDLKQFISFVVFGDSYTDDSRLTYFITHNGSAPPVGWVDPVNYDAADGGRVWAEYVKQYTGCNLYNYAVSGAVCSNEITPRWFSAIDAPFPAVKQYEVPAYLNDSHYYENGTKWMTDPANETVYAIWIGTNDLGYYAFIDDEQVKGTNITTYVDCVYDQLQRVYENGGRYFVIMNVAPLNLAPIYAMPPYAAGPNQFWPTKAGNYSAISGRMMEQVVTVNAIYEYRTPFSVELAKRYPGSSFALYDVHGLVCPKYLNYHSSMSSNRVQLTSSCYLTDDRYI